MALGDAVGIGGFAIVATLNLITPDGQLLLDPDGNPLTITTGE